MPELRPWLEENWRAVLLAVAILLVVGGAVAASAVLGGDSGTGHTADRPTNQGGGVSMDGPGDDTGGDDAANESDGDDVSSDDEDTPTPDGRVIVFGPDDNATIDDYQVEFRFDVEVSTAGHAELVVDDRVVHRAGLEPGSNAISETVKLSDSGEHDWFVRVDASSTFETDARSFETTTDLPGIDVATRGPDDGAVLDDYEVTLEYGFDSPVEFEYEVLLDGEVIEDLELLAGQGESRSTTVHLEAGEHEWQVRATDPATGETYESEVRQFQTTADRPVAETTLDRPRENGTVESPVGFAYAIRTFEPVEYRLMIDGEANATGRLEAGERFVRQLGDLTVDLDPGTHEWWIEVTSVETGETNESDHREVAVGG